MKRLTSAGIAALIILIAVSTASAQKIGVVDSKSVLESMPEVGAANQKLQALQKNWQDSINLLNTAIQSKADAYKKVLDTMTPERKDQANAELSGMQENVRKYSEAKLGQEGELAQQQQTLFRPIFDKVKEAIGSIAKKEKLGVILDKNAGGVLFSDGAEDITSKVADSLKAAK